jgi:hypothetical protein
MQDEQVVAPEEKAPEATPEAAPEEEAIEKARDEELEEREFEDDEIEKHRTKGHMMDVGSGTFSVDLPCGYIDRDGNLHRTMLVGEMTGYEEDILAGKGEVIPRINKVISNCAKKIGDIEDRRQIAQAVAHLTASDRMAALIAIRRISLGDYYDVKIRCPNEKCGDESRFNLDLGNVELLMMKNPTERKRADTLASGKVVEWHIMSARDEEWLTAKQKKKEDLLTLNLLARVDKVDDMEVSKLRDDKKTYPKALKILKRLSIRERNEIRDLFDEVEGSVETKVEFKCPSCGWEWEADMEVGQPAFFFHSGK